jgi:hypothetical protein
VLSQAANPLRDASAVRKRRVQLNNIQQSDVWTSKLSICKKCEQYLIPVCQPNSSWPITPLQYVLLKK